MLIGLTGGIACGKSTVAALLRARGAVVVDADEVARAVVAPGQPALADIAAAFGPTVLDATGALDRPALARAVFGDPAARRQLEAFTHPRIAAESAVRLAEAQRTGAPLVVYDAALLFESGRAEAFRPILCVTATPEVQRARLMARDGLDLAQAEARVAAQMPVAEKAARADRTIDNSGDRVATEAQVAALWRDWVEHPSPEGPRE